MIKQIYKQKGRTATSAIVRHNCVEVKLAILVHTSARFLEDENSICYTTILRIDKEVLENDIPQPKMRDVQGVLIDEKYLGSS